jgi:apolipoprotein N-acyltransferase
MLKKHRIIYSVASGILLCLAWYQSFSGWFLWIAFIPLLLVEESLLKDKSAKTAKSVFLYASVAFLIWNTGTTWWIANASFAGAGAAIAINTFLFSGIFWLYHSTRKIAGGVLGSIVLVAYWVAFEYFYLNAEISWPWLNLGNGLAHNARYIQWYEYTGTLGGTVWILLVNLSLFRLIKEYLADGKGSALRARALLAVSLVVVPVLLSLLIYNNYKEISDPCQIVIIQPNMNPYKRDFSVKEQCNTIIHLAEEKDLKGTRYLLTPEVTLEDNIWENSIRKNYSLPVLSLFIAKHPETQLILGAFTYKKFERVDSLSSTAQWMKRGGFYYDSHNSALQIDSSHLVQVYHKSKLVVGIEKMPYQKQLRFLQKTVEGLGGSFNSYAAQNTRGVLISSDKKTMIGPVICYESVYGEFVAGYVKNGANFIFILTNDGWWGNTPGYRQHLSYACLRAIETRRSIARAANTGISAFINQRGEIIDSLGWGRKGTMEGIINANHFETFYVRHGDYLGRWACIISPCLMLFTIFLFVVKRKK